MPKALVDTGIWFLCATYGARLVDDSLEQNTRSTRAHAKTLVFTALLLLYTSCARMHV